jgi:hypothetical protein
MHNCPNRPVDETSRETQKLVTKFNLSSTTDERLNGAVGGRGKAPMGRKAVAGWPQVIHHRSSVPEMDKKEEEREGWPSTFTSGAAGWMLTNVVCGLCEQYRVFTSLKI